MSLFNFYEKKLVRFLVVIFKHNFYTITTYWDFTALFILLLEYFIHL